MLDALKRLEGRRLLRPLAVPVEPAIAHPLWLPQGSEAIAPPPAPPLAAVDEECREACESTTVTIEPTAIVLGREVAMTPGLPELPTVLLQEVEDLRREIAHALCDDEPATISLVAPDKPKRKAGNRTVCHLPVAKEILEPYRSIRDRILGQITSNRSAMLLLTSPDPCDVGLIWPLAVVCGERNRGEVLFVDATLNSSLARSYPNSASQVGIEDVLEGRMTWDDVVRSTTAANVRLLTQGKNPARAETSEFSLWDDLRQQYSLVVVAAECATDSSTLWLAPLCDATYLVVELGASQRTEAAKARQSLEASGCNLLGCIVLSPR